MCCGEGRQPTGQRSLSVECIFMLHQSHQTDDRVGPTWSEHRTWFNLVFRVGSVLDQIMGSEFVSFVSLTHSSHRTTTSDLCD